MQHGACFLPEASSTLKRNRRDPDPRPTWLAHFFGASFKRGLDPNSDGFVSDEGFGHTMIDHLRVSVEFKNQPLMVLPPPPRKNNIPPLSFLRSALCSLLRSAASNIFMALIEEKDSSTCSGLQVGRVDQENTHSHTVGLYERSP